MKNRLKKSQKLRKGVPSAVLLSIAIHVGLFLLAGWLVVFTVVKQKEVEFAPPKAVERPKMKLKKPKVKIKKTTKPKPTTRIVTKVNRTSMPDIQLPEMSGMGEGLADGLAGFDLMPDLGEVSVMGSGQSIGNDFEGRFYNLQRDRSGRTIPCSDDKYREIVRKFILNGWKPSSLARYYQSPKKLYTTTFMIPTMPSTIAKDAFGEGDTEGDFWMVHYKGQLVCPASHTNGITFRFVGSGDGILVVRVAGEIALGVGWPSSEVVILGNIWSSSSADSRKYRMGNNTAVVGDWITLKPGDMLDMEVIMADAAGSSLLGECCLMLAVQEKGVEYERRMMVGGAPILPAFKTAELSHDVLDAIYQNLVRDEVCLTNGPIFCDYDTKAVAISASSTKSVPPPAAASDESAVRTWTSLAGKTMQARLITVIGDKAVLETDKGKKKKIPLAQLSAKDREYVELANPPKLDIDFNAKTTQIFSIYDGNPTGITVARNYRAKVRLKQKSAGAYNHELTVEFFAIGKEIHGDRYVLLDRQKGCFAPTAENSYELIGKPVRIPDFTLDTLHRGIKKSGYLVTVTDSRGKIILHKESSPWLYENLENLKTLPVRAFMDKTCTRVFPTGPKRLY